MNPVLQFIAEVARLAESFGTQLKLRGFKSGGTSGQVPVKNSSDAFDWSWGTPSWTDFGTCPSVTFSTTPANELFTLGELKWNVGEDALAYGVDGGSVALGKELFDYFTNASGTTLVKGDLVSVVSATAGRRTVDLTDLTDTESIAACIGMVVQGAADTGKVRVALSGKVRGLNTDAWSEGAAVYIDPANPGKWIAARPTAPEVSDWCRGGLPRVRRGCRRPVAPRYKFAESHRRLGSADDHRATSGMEPDDRSVGSVR